MKEAIAVLGAALVAAAVLAGAGSAAVTTVEVTPANLHGWSIAPDGNVSYAFVSGPASIGKGSLQFSAINNDASAPNEKFIMASPYTGLVSDLTGFTYDFYIAAAGASGATAYKQFYVNVYVDSSANGIGTTASFYDCRYDSVPTTGTVGTWNTHGFTQTSTWTNVASPLAGCPATLALLPAGSKVILIVLNGGDSTNSDQGLAGGFDKVVISAAGDVTTYDFEPALTPASKDECKNGHWADYNTPHFRNQGDCVSYVATGGKNGGNG